MIASIITALYLMGILTAATAANFLYVSGALLIAAEIALGLFGLVAFNGLLALFFGYVIQTGNNHIFGIPLDWGLLFGIAFVEVAVIAASVAIIMTNQKRKISTGVESMIGHKAAILEWKGSKGQVLLQGEHWAARSDKDLALSPGDEVTVASVKGLTVTITA